MAQYCRYCIHLCVNNVPWCEAKKTTMRESACKRPNNCDKFIFADCEPEYQDAFGETKGYHPRSSAPHKKVEKGQKKEQLGLF